MKFREVNIFTGVSEADGTHPTGMHSCYFLKVVTIKDHIRNDISQVTFIPFSLTTNRTLA